VGDRNETEKAAAFLVFICGRKNVKQIKEKLACIFGAENVSDDSGMLEAYAGDMSFEKPIAPQFVVKAHSAEEIEALVKWANGTKTPLVPVSSKAPHYKGDTVPGVPEAVIVDLSGMKRILGISRRHRIAVIEPGVTYGELGAALEKAGMCVSTSLAPREGKSVVTSVLETEPRLNALHQWCNLDPLRCAEVTWGDGNRMYTGEAGGSAMGLEEQWKEDKWQWEPAGPMMLDFYRLLTGAQGTMGIVTWASVRCEIKPEAHRSILGPAKRLEDLIDFVYNVLRLRFSDEFLIMNGALLASLVAENADEVNYFRRQFPPWIAVIGIAGREILPAERVAYQEADIRGIAQDHGVKIVPTAGGVSADRILEKASSMSGPYWKETYRGAFQDIFFSTTLDRTPEFIRAMKEMAEEENYPADDIGIYLQPENMGTSYHCSFTLPYDPADDLETRRVKGLFEKASIVFSHMGAYYFRPYGIWSKLQLNKDAQSYDALRRLKGIFDPAGIMNPGKLRNN
jgi:FAD/FMN-containing dehydrogenase